MNKIFSRQAAPNLRLLIMPRLYANKEILIDTAGSKDDAPASSFL